MRTITCRRVGKTLQLEAMIYQAIKEGKTVKIEKDFIRVYDENDKRI